MAYSDFTFDDLTNKLGLVVGSRALYEQVESRPLPATLSEWLKRHGQDAPLMGTEKARSEMIVAPVLAELHSEHRDRLSYHSGVALNVDEAKGLNGVCDFVISGSPFLLLLEAPVMVLVEAKRENLTAGVPQCIAEMVAAIRYNAHRKRPVCTMFGAVTSGTDWRFLQLTGSEALVDTRDYHISQPEKIYGILEHITLELSPNLN